MEKWGRNFDKKDPRDKVGEGHKCLRKWRVRDKETPNPEQIKLSLASYETTF